jgi:circadian clock protein KaiC
MKDLDTGKENLAATQETDSPTKELPKAPTGIRGFDDITFGGLPEGRPTLVAGGAGSGKTLFGMEFLVRGATLFDEPGVFISFEELERDLVKNVASLGFDLEELTAQKKILLDYVYIERSEIEETGEYDLDGLFIRMGYAIDAIGAKRVVLDTLEALFSGFPNTSILRAEIRRLFRWLKDRGVSTVITAEQGQEGTLTRHGLEEYVSDCVIVLDHRVNEQLSTRRLRVAKYRGSMHGTNEYPFLIDKGGISVLPITSVGLDYTVSSERVSTGIPRLDTMFGGKGYFRGSSVLVSGSAGTGKSSVAAKFAESACARGETCLYYAFEESSSQIIRNMRSIGIDLDRWEKEGLLYFRALRPTFYGIEMHLTTMHDAVNTIKPNMVVIDPISNLIASGSLNDVKAALMRLVDLFKKKGITSLFTSLAAGRNEVEQSAVGVSSIMDTWIQLLELESGGERNRGLQVIKSRGMPHSNQIREFLFDENGIQLVDAYVGPAGVLMGSARASQEARERAESHALDHEMERKKRELDRKRQELEAQISVLRAQFEAEEERLKKGLEEESVKREAMEMERRKMAVLRQAD